jgi:hypothetical protein
VGFFPFAPVAAPPSGAASGALAGSYPAPSLAVPVQSSGNIDISGAGSGLRVAEGSGSNSKQGVFTLTGGATQAVPCTAVTASSRIFMTAQVTGGTPGLIGVASRIPATSFTVFCVATDTSTYAYEIFEPG